MSASRRDSETLSHGGKQSQEYLCAPAKFIHNYLYNEGRAQAIYNPTILYKTKTYVRQCAVQLYMITKLSLTTHIQTAFMTC